MGESIIRTRAQKKAEVHNIEALVPSHFYELKNFKNKEDWYRNYYDEINSLEQVGDFKIIKIPEGAEVLPILQRNRTARKILKKKFRKVKKITNFFNSLI